MKTNAQYFRKGRIITGPEGTTKHKSINLAKRTSKNIQLKHDGYIGRGILRLA